MEPEEISQLNKEVCEFLGIEPEIEKFEWSRDNKGHIYAGKLLKQPCVIYPEVSTWGGLGLVIAALKKLEEEKNIYWARNKLGLVWLEDLEKSKSYCDGGPLPLALAKTVQQMAKESAMNEECTSVTNQGTA